MQADQVKLLSSTKAFGGFLYKYSHPSYACNCEMKFNIYLPAAAVSAAKNKDATKYPALYFLSGLTCNEDNFMIKSGAIKVAAEKNLILIAPDTSPRGCNIQGEDESWDMGVAASYYLDATVNKWSNNYRMYTYITKELPQILNADFPIVISIPFIPFRSIPHLYNVVQYLYLVR
jgi:S-formylglutathione hydrolase